MQNSNEYHVRTTSVIQQNELNVKINIKFRSFLSKSRSAENFTEYEHQR